MTQKRIVIVGSGSAGMSCALKLKDAGTNFTIISDTLGGRIRYDAKEKVNFGAYFIMSNYHNAKRLVKRETWINPFSVVFHNSATEYFPTVSLHTLCLLPQFIRLVGIMRKFYRHYEPYKKNCEIMTQREALEKDPYINRLFSQTAASFVAESGIQKLADDYVSKFSYACTGVAMDQLTALDFLNVTQGMVIPIHRFSFDEPAMAGQLGASLVRDTVTQVDRMGDGWRLITAAGKVIEAEILVMATPAVVTQQLIGKPDTIRQACRLYVYHVTAKLKAKFDTHEMNVFPFESKVIFTAIQDDKTYLIYTREEDESLLNEVCESYSLISRYGWERALYVCGEGYMEQLPERNLIIAGDHNGLGLEPTAVSGIFAANTILKGC